MLYKKIRKFLNLFSLNFYTIKVTKPQSAKVHIFLVTLLPDS